MQQYEGNGVGLRLRFEELKQISLLDITSVLYDLNLLYDFAVLVTVPDYEDFSFSRFFFYRNGRSLKSEHKLYVKKIRLESPLEIVLTITTLTSGVLVTLNTFIDLVGKIKTWKIKKEKLKSGLNNSRLNSKRIGTTTERIESKSLTEDEINLKIKEGKREITVSKIIRKLEESKLTVVDADFYDTNESKDENANETTK